MSRIRLQKASAAAGEASAGRGREDPRVAWPRHAVELAGTAAHACDLDVAPEFVCLSFNAWGAAPAPRFRGSALALALENNQ